MYAYNNNPYVVYHRFPTFQWLLLYIRIIIYDYLLKLHNAKEMQLLYYCVAFFSHMTINTLNQPLFEYFVIK